MLINNRLYPAQAPVVIQAVSASTLAVSLPDGTSASVSKNVVGDAGIIKRITVKTIDAIRDHPSEGTPRKMPVAPGINFR